MEINPSASVGMTRYQNMSGIEMPDGGQQLSKSIFLRTCVLLIQWVLCAASIQNQAAKLGFLFTARMEIRVNNLLI